LDFLELHSWDMDCRQAIALQVELSKSVSIRPLDRNVKIIAGADVSYSRTKQALFAAVIVFDYSTLEPIETSMATGTACYPYVPGLLTFREAPVLLSAFRKIKTCLDVVMFDGQGIAHPRGMGLASHLGLFLNVATIGCAKKRLVGEHIIVGSVVGDRVPLYLQQKLVGYVVRTKKNVKPVYVSPGHLIDFDQAVDIVLHTTRGYRLPEPTRQAHLAVNRIRANTDNA